MKIIKFRRPLKKRIQKPGIGQKPTKTKGECCCQTLTGFPPSAFWGLAATLLTLLDGIDAGRWDSQPKGDPKQKKHPKAESANGMDWFVSLLYT